MIKVQRPKASVKKVTTKDDFELTYLRHQYLRRSKYNPTKEQIEPYMWIIKHVSKSTFFTYFNLFRATGFYYDDIVSIGMVHLVSFLNLYVVEASKEKKREFEYKFYEKCKKEPKKWDYQQKNKANFTYFLRQRMDDLVRVCRQKSRNIKGQKPEEYVVFCGAGELPKNPASLIKDYSELGFKKVELSVFKSIRKKANVNHDATVFRFNNLLYVAFQLEQKELEIDDFTNSASNPYDNEHSLKPDDRYEEVQMEKSFLEFLNKSEYRKKAILRNFVAKYKNKRQYREEVATARRLIKTLEA